MSAKRPRTSTSIRELPPPRWWGEYVVDNSPGGRRFVIHWRRILAVLASLGFVGYLSCATLLWGYYSFSRRVPGVHWIDVAVPGRFSRVESALAAFHNKQAQRLWLEKDYGAAILAARSAVAEDPCNIEARLYLADCWRRAGRFQEAVRVLRKGIEVDAGDSRLQFAVVQTCLDAGLYQDLLKALREDFPSHGAPLLDGSDPGFQLAEVRAVLEISGAAAAELVAKRHPGLAGVTAAAPTLSQIDWELGLKEIALDRLGRALERDPKNFNIQDARIETLLRMHRTKDAKDGARRFLGEFPGLATPQLRMLEAYGSRKGTDGAVWTSLCIRFLERYHRDAAAMSQLGSLAASNGWTDLAFVLYQDSLQQNLAGFPFAVYYASSLLKAGDMAAADEVWHDLSVHNAPEIVPASYVTAMVEWGNGRRSDAEPILDRIRRQTNTDQHTRRMIEDIFRSFGFVEMAERLGAP